MKHALVEPLRLGIEGKQGIPAGIKGSGDLELGGDTCVAGPSAQRLSPGSQRLKLGSHAESLSEMLRHTTRGRRPSG